MDAVKLNDIYVPRFANVLFQKALRARYFYYFLTFFIYLNFAERQNKSKQEKKRKEKCVFNENVNKYCVLLDVASALFRLLNFTSLRNDKRKKTDNNERKEE